jgi:LPS export ABC transporter protein LptC
MKVPKNSVFPASGKVFAFCVLLILFLGSCTFDYGQSDSAENDLPDLVMENVQYVRVRSADPIARFQAERAERYEKRGIMELLNFTFEQFGDHGRDVNAFGRAGSASVEINSGDIRMDGGVRLEVESQDIAIETQRLAWKDDDRILSAGEDEEVNIYQSNGTKFSGIGFQAYARSHSWEFASGVSGIYIYEEKDEETEETNKTELMGEQ